MDEKRNLYYSEYYGMRRSNMENYTRVIFHFDDVCIEDLIGVLEPTITDIFGNGYWDGNTYVTIINEKYIYDLTEDLSMVLYNDFAIRYELPHCCPIKEFNIKILGRYATIACKVYAEMYRKEYTDNIIKNLMSFDIYQGKERSTGKFKTTVKWSDGEVVTLRADKNTLPIYYIFAYAYCERKYGSNSAFKKYVDRHCVKMDKELIFEDDGIMTSMRIYQYGNGHPAIDLYSRVALLIAAKAYGGVEKLKTVASDALH